MCCGFFYDGYCGPVGVFVSDVMTLIERMFNAQCEIFVHFVIIVYL